MDHAEIIRAFGILYRTFISYTDHALQEQDLSYSDSIFLVNIGAKEGITQEEISTTLAIDKAAVARSVKQMSAKGYVKTIPSEVDRRAKELYLTEMGKELYQLMQRINGKWMDYILNEFSPQEIERLSQMLGKMGNMAKKYKHGDAEKTD